MTDNEPIQTSGQSGSEQELGYLRAEVEHLRRRLGSEGSTDSRLADIEADVAIAGIGQPGRPARVIGPAGTSVRLRMSSHTGQAGNGGRRQGRKQDPRFHDFLSKAEADVEETRFFRVLRASPCKTGPMRTISRHRRAGLPTVPAKRCSFSQLGHTFFVCSVRVFLQRRYPGVGPPRQQPRAQDGRWIETGGHRERNLCSTGAGTRRVG